MIPINEIEGKLISVTEFEIFFTPKNRKLLKIALSYILATETDNEFLEMIIELIHETMKQPNFVKLFRFHNTLSVILNHAYYLMTMKSDLLKIKDQKDQLKIIVQAYLDETKRKAIRSAYLEPTEILFKRRLSSQSVPRI